jgi:lipopolysaccharide export system protein LptC
MATTKMTKNRKIYPFFLFFFIISALGLSTFLYVRSDSTEQNTLKLSDTFPTAFGKNILITSYNKDGLMSSKIASPMVFHYTNNSTRFKHPHIILHELQTTTPKNPWIITANEGLAEKGSAKITFWDDVRIAQKGLANQKDTLITTSRITYFPGKHFAETDQAITLIQDGVRLDSVGLRAFLDQKQFDLLSKVRGSYVPTPQ